MLTQNQFQQGIKIFRSCGGPKLDTQTIEIWFRMLARLEPPDFEGAIMALCEEVTEMGSINFVAEIKQRARILAERRKRMQAGSSDNLLEGGGEYIAKEMVTDFLKKFNLKAV